MAKEIVEILNNWKIKADNDLKVSEKELLSDNPITDAICFDSQQSAEKYLKLFLIYHNIEPKKTHLISDLLVECVKINNDFDELKEYSYLSEYAVELRYPDDFYIPKIEEAQEAFESALYIRDFVLTRIS